MEEIRIHGRGGQGTVVASVILAKAFFAAGYEVQTFPAFGVERRGAPVEAYLRLDTARILIRSNIYTPDHVLVQDARLVGTVDVTAGLRAGGWILMNTPEAPADMQTFSGFRFASVDATRIAVANRLGTRTHPIINTAMVGAFAKVLEKPPLEMVAAAIREEIQAKTGANVQAARDAYAAVNLVDL